MPAQHSRPLTKDQPTLRAVPVTARTDRDASEQVRTSLPGVNHPRPSKTDHYLPPEPHDLLQSTRFSSLDRQENFSCQPPTSHRKPLTLEHLPSSRAANGDQTTSNAIEQARTPLTDQDLPIPTNTYHPNHTISRKTLVFLRWTAYENFPVNHQPAAEAPCHPSSVPPADADQTTSNRTEQARTPMPYQDLPKPTRTNHPDHTISCETLVFPPLHRARTFSVQPPTGRRNTARPNNALAANPGELGRAGRVPCRPCLQRSVSAASPSATVRCSP